MRAALACRVAALVGPHPVSWAELLPVLAGLGDAEAGDVNVDVELHENGVSGVAGGAV
jgi:hypothetical protein